MLKNMIKHREKLAFDQGETRPHYGLRKLSVGVASVLLSTSLWFNADKPQQVKADTNTDPEVDNHAQTGMEQVQQEASQTQEFNQKRTQAPANSGSNTSSSANTANTPQQAPSQNVQTQTQQTQQVPSQSTSTQSASTQTAPTQQFNNKPTDQGQLNYNANQASQAQNNANSVTNNLPSNNQQNITTAQSAIDHSQANNTLSRTNNSAVDNANARLNNNLPTDNSAKNTSDQAQVKIQKFNSNHAANQKTKDLTIPAKPLNGKLASLGKLKTDLPKNSTDSLNQSLISAKTTIKQNNNASLANRDTNVQTQQEQASGEDGQSNLAKNARKAVQDFNINLPSFYALNVNQLPYKNVTDNLKNNLNSVIPDKAEQRRLAMLLGTSLMQDDGDDDDDGTNPALEDDQGTATSPVSDVVTFDGHNGSVSSSDEAKWGIIPIPNSTSAENPASVINPGTQEDVTKQLRLINKMKVTYRIDLGNNQYYTYPDPSTAQVVFYRTAAYKKSNPSYIIYQNWHNIHYDNVSYPDAGKTTAESILDDDSNLKDTDGNSLLKLESITKNRQAQKINDKRYADDYVHSHNIQPTDGNEYYIFTFKLNVPDTQITKKAIIHYVDTDDNPVAPDNTQTFVFTKKAYLEDNGSNLPTIVYRMTLEQPYRMTLEQPIYSTEVTSPTIVGKKPDQDVVRAREIDPNHNGDYETTVTYHADYATGEVDFYDKTKDKLLNVKNLVPDSGTGRPQFTVGEDTGYNTKEDIKNYEDAGYGLVSDSTDGQDIIMKANPEDNKYKVVLEHHIDTTMEGKGQTIDRTIHYVGAGDKTPKDVVQKAGKTRTKTVDEVIYKNNDLGGPDKAVTYSPWKITNNFDQVNTPQISNYTPDKASVPQETVTPDTKSSTITVTYHADPNQPQDVEHTRTINLHFPSSSTGKDQTEKQVVKGQPNNPGNYPEYNVPVENGYHTDKSNVPQDTADKDKTVDVYYQPNGKIIPVDPKGNPIPNANNPSYNNDPNDPTKVTTTATPDVPGYHTSTKNVNPTDPSKDTNVTYEKDPDPVAHKEQANIIIRFFDKNISNSLYDYHITDDIGHTITWNEKPTIQAYLNEGYKLISDGYSNVLGKQITQNMDNHIYYIYFEHDIVPIHGNDPIPKGRHKGEPAGLVEYGKATTIYTYNMIDGPKAHDDHVQQIEYDADGTVDLVTGKVTRTSDYYLKPGQTVQKIIYPISGYNGSIVSDTMQGRNETIHVVYKKADSNVKIIFVDHDTGKPINTITDTGKPGDSVPYPKDQVDTYTHQGYDYDPNKWPNPKYTDHDQTITIELNHKHQPVNNKVTVTQTIHYVGPDGKQIQPDNTQTVTFIHHGSKDLVTGKTTYQDDDDWTKPKATEPVASPDVKGYKPDKNLIPANSYKNTDKGQEITVHYSALPKAQGLVTVTYFDVDTGNRVLAKKSFTGNVGGDTGYNTGKDIAYFAGMHYLLSKDETGGKDLLINKDDKYNHYAVFLKHEMQPGFTRQKTVKRTITYVTPDGTTPPKQVVQTLVFNDQGEKDLVTNKMVWNSDLTPIRHTFNGVATPKLDGLEPDQDNVASRDINIDSDNWNQNLDQNITVTYHKKDTGNKTPAPAPKDDGIVPPEQEFNPDRAHQHQSDNGDNDNGKRQPKKKAKNANKGNDLGNNNGNAGRANNGNNGNTNNGNGNANNGNGNGNGNNNANTANNNGNGDNNANANTANSNGNGDNNANANANNANRKALTNAKHLPQTGENDNTGYLLLGLMSAVSSLGLAGVEFSKRKKRA